jgi:peroxiredoxin (alkyl hydroperoxide reductase subunit C)
MIVKSSVTNVTPSEATTSFITVTIKLKIMEQIVEKTEVFQIPRIGDQAPDFSAKTTQGEIKFSEFGKDKWVVMFSHPADFTPVCTTEMSGFAKRKAEFEALNTELLGLSIDSIHAHLGWVDNVRKNTGVYFDFPIIADLDMKVSKLYGMLQPNESETAAVRAVFFIDPEKKVRLIMYYPLNVGRNMDEILRALEALQTSDKHKVAMPLDWKKGDKVIVPPPKTLSELEERLNDDSLEKVDWYLAKKELAN